MCRGRTLSRLHAAPSASGYIARSFFEQTMAALDGAAWMAAHASTKEGFKTWLEDLADNAQIPVADFVGDLAVELKSSSLLSEAEYGTAHLRGRWLHR